MIWPFNKIRDFLWDIIVRWLTYEGANPNVPLSDFDRLRYELRPGDVLLIEGRSNVSGIIKAITNSIWSHSVLYIGRLHDIDDEDVRKQILKFYDCPPDEQLIIESMLGQGTIVDSISKYKGEHLRICRPRGLTRTDAQHVNNYAVNQLGTDYHVRQLLDLARFLFPYWWIPKRWRSTLFEHNAGRPTKTVCSAMMAEAFAAVQFPIRPVLYQNGNGKLKIYRRNAKLVTPSDFDYSPYFDVIKYPILDMDDLAVYKKLPWEHDITHSHVTGEGVIADEESLDLAKTGRIEPVKKSMEIEDTPDDCRTGSEEPLKLNLDRTYKES